MAVGAKLDLRLIDETYGKRADLYKDVLKVPKTATSEEIQLAYYDRRTELFALLGKIDAKARHDSSAEQRRYLAEKKMDSVVFALRILGDPAMRKAYNKVRMERTGAAGSQKNGATKVSKVKTLKNPRQSIVESSSLDSKYLLQSSFSDSIFANLSSRDDSDEDRNPRKSTRRQKQQPSSAKREEPVLKAEKEKRSIWGRKKKSKRKKQGKDALNDTMDTDTSMTDNEDEMNTMTDPSSIFVGVEPDSNTDAEFRRRGDDETRTNFDDETRTYRTYDDETRTYGDDETRTYFDDGSIVTDMMQHRGGPCDAGGVFGCISGSRAFRKLANEVSGACEDTLTSVDQVFNAFTLTDNDIKAVTKKIERVEKQFFN